MRGVNPVISPPFLIRALRGGPFRSLSSYPYFDSDRDSGEWRRRCSGQEVDDCLKPKEVVIYQYKGCPFGNKVSVFLDYYKIPYKVVNEIPITISTKDKIKWSHHKSLPLFVVDDQPTLDSSDLINKLVKRMHPDYDLNADEEEKKWREWVDNYLVHVVSANMYGTFYDALHSFTYVARVHRYLYESMLWLAEDYSLSERLERKATMYGCAATMYYVTRKLKKKHNITDAREALFLAAIQWLSALKCRVFLGGRNNPTLADLAVYGVLKSIRSHEANLGTSLHPDVIHSHWLYSWCSGMDAAIGGCSKVSESGPPIPGARPSSTKEKNERKRANEGSFATVAMNAAMFLNVNPEVQALGVHLP